MKQISRRQALKLIGITSVGGILAACAQATATPAPVQPTAVPLPTDTVAPNQTHQHPRTHPTAVPTKGKP